MPIYEYECEKCGHRLEKIQKFSDPPLETCPKCGGALHKMQSAPAFHLKGTGWYATDYPKSGASSESKETKPTPESAKTDKSEKSESAKTDAAPAAPAKTETKSGD
jgi:putative FmdB family regulatory protein